MIGFWPVGGFMHMVWGIMRARWAAVAAAGEVLGPACAKAGLNYAFIVVGEHNPHTVRFLLPAGAAVELQPVGGVAASVVPQAAMAMAVATAQPAMAVATAIPIAAPQPFQVVVPTGVAPGGAIVVATPSGQQVQVTCPPGVAPGTPMLVNA